MRNPLVPVFVFLGYVLLEIFGFAWIGGKVGALATVALVIVTAMLGLLVLRLEGVAHFRRMQAMLAQGQLPQVEVVETWLMAIAAVLLVVPGFFSDVAGALLLVPPLRRSLARRWLASGVLRSGAVRSGQAAQGTTIEGEWRAPDDAPAEASEGRPGSTAEPGPGRKPLGRDE